MAIFRPGHLSHNDEHLPAGGPKVEMQKQMFCFFVPLRSIYPAVSQCACPQCRRRFLVLPSFGCTARFYGGFQADVPLPSSVSLSAAVDASRHAVGVVTEPQMCADGAGKGLLRSGLSCFAAGSLREAAGRGDE